MVEPIWKDKYITIGDESAESFPFRVYVQNSQLPYIYEGKAYKRPGDEDCKVRINDICADFISNTLPTLSDLQFSYLKFPLTFVFEWYSEDSGEWISESVTFVNDWSYDRLYDAERDGMSHPINGHINANQWVMWTGLNVSSIVANLTYKDGTTDKVTIPIAISANFNSDFNTDFARSARSSGSGTAVFDVSQWQNLDRIDINGVTYKVVSDCKRYVLYYANAYGGWDSLLIEGNAKEKDALTRYTREVEYDNTDVTNRGKKNYVNEVVKSFELTTGWLADEESKRMHHLVNSTDVYLYDILTKEMCPVIIPTTSLTYKTYKNNGGKLVNYSLEVSVADNRTRR